MNGMTPSRRVVILLFDEVEVLDACGPFEVFSVAGRRNGLVPFEVLTAAERGPVLARNGLSLNPHHLLADAPAADLLLVPGGPGSRRELHNPLLLEWIRRAADRAELVLSVCTGALLLGKAGLLDGLEATTHHGAFDLLAEVAPRAKLRPDRRVVDNGRVVLSAGVAAGIDMSLHVVGRLLGHDLAIETARYMEYPWAPSPSPA
jgi:transcriptional regulator GlxA family with amidase domain